MVIDPNFKKQIVYLDFESIQDSPDNVCIVDSNMILKGFNKAWIDFAEKNNGLNILKKYPIGSNIGNVGPELIRSYLNKKYHDALVQNQPFSHTYECSSDKLLRIFHQTAYPLVNGKGFVISHHLVRESQHGEKEYELFQELIDQSGIIIQCQNCRKIRNPLKKNQWFWVPSLVKDPFHNTSHSICDRCIDHYYPDI